MDFQLRDLTAISNGMIAERKDSGDRNSDQNGTCSFVCASQIPFTQERLFDWHSAAGAFKRLAPPWAPPQILSKCGFGIEKGVRVVLRVPLALGISQKWEHLHDACERPNYFRDIQVRGPFPLWRHTHRFIKNPQEGAPTTLKDEIEFTPPLGMIGRIISKNFILKNLNRVFRYRHSVTVRDLTVAAKYPSAKPLSVAVSGASGLIGSQLSAFLSTCGHHVTRLVRHEPTSSDEIQWSPEGGIHASTPTFDAVIHLAGEGIAEKRWSSERKDKIVKSRVDGTRALLNSFANSKTPPKTFITASAIGFFGDRGDELLDETSSIGSGFLPSTCKAWEGLAEESSKRCGARNIALRFGIVLSPEGGALKKMLLPFSLGLGGPLGSGKQFMSWIHLHDAVYAIYHLLMREDLSGPFVVTAPNPVSNSEFTKALGRVLKRPTLFRVPPFVLKILFGEMAEAALLSSTRAVPKGLTDSGFVFSYPEIEEGMRQVLGK